MRVLSYLVGLLVSPLAWALPAQTYADTSNLSDLLKEVYDPVIEQQQNLEAFTWNEFDNGDAELGGQGWVFSTIMGGNQEGIATRPESGTLPSAGHQRYVQGLIYWANCYGAFELTGQAIEAAKRNVEAFANSKTEEIEGLTRDVMKDMNRQVYGDGLGTLALVSEAASSGSNPFFVQDGQYLRVNMIIDVLDAGTPGTKNVDSQTIPSLTAAPNATYPYRVQVGSLTIANALAAGDIVVRENTRDAATGLIGYDIEGIGAIADDGTAVTTYLNISRSTYNLWKGHLLDNGGTERNLTLDLMQQLEDQIFLAANKRPDWVRMNLGQRRKFFDLVGPDKRYMTGDIDGGYERLKYNGLTLTIDVDHPHGEITMLTKSTIKKYALRKFGLLDFDGLVLRQVSGQDVWRGYVGTYANLGCKRPNCNGRLTDLVEPASEGAWVW